MAIRTYKVTLDSKNTIAPEPVFLRQGDKTGAVVIDATLTDNGSPVIISGFKLSFMANTADGQALIADTNGFNVVNATGGEFTYRVPSQLGSVPGKIKIAYFSLTDSSGAQSTFNVAFIVEQAVDMTQGNAEDWVSNLDNIKDVIESIDPSGKLLQEVIDARGNFAQLGDRENAQDNAITQNASKSDLINLANRIIPGTPREVFKNVADLKAKYPAGTTGIVVVNAPDGTGHWYYWDSEWKDGGLYIGTIAGDSEIERIAMKSAKTLNGTNVEAIASVNDNGKAGDSNFYVIGKVFNPAYLSKVAFYTFKNAEAKIAIFEVGVGSIDSDQTIPCDLISYKTTTAIAGMNYVDFNIDIKRHYLIGIKCDGISYTLGAGYRIYRAADFDGMTGNSYNLGFKLESDSLGLSVYAMTNAKLAKATYYSKNILKPMTMLDQTQPTIDAEKYPITFDFPNKKIVISQLIGMLSDTDNGKAVDFADLSGTYTLPDPNKSSSLPQNYYVFFDIQTRKIVIKYSDGALSPINEFDANSQLYVTGISVRNLNQPKAVVNIFTANYSRVKVIINRADGTADSYEDIVTQNIIDGGLYNLKYVAVGDSITEGQDPDNNYAPAIGHRYSDWVARRTGMTVVNMGVGGSTVRNNGLNSVFARITKVPAADVVTILAGTNDFGTSTPIGEYGGDVTKQFKPAFDQVVRYMMSRDEQLIIITPLNRKQQTNDLGLTLQDYVDVELEVAKKYGVPVLDLFNEYQYHTLYSDNYKKFMPDNLHPNAAGYDKIGRRVTNFIQEIMANR